MKYESSGSVLLICCYVSAVTVQNGNRYLEKPLPAGWGDGYSEPQGLLPQMNHHGIRR